MARKQKNEEVNTPQETPQPKQELSNEERELVKAALKLALAERCKNAIMITIATLAKHIQLLLPFNIDTKTLMEYIKAELAKDYKLITLLDRIGNEELRIEAVLLSYDMIDASLDSVEDYMA